MLRKSLKMSDLNVLILHRLAMRRVWVNYCADNGPKSQQITPQLQRFYSE